MTTYTFIKENGRWHIDAPDFINKGGSKADLDMIAGADTLLNLLSEGADEVTLTFNTEPFEDAETLELLQLCGPFMDGGYYCMRKYKGKEIDFNMWVSDVTKFVFGSTPKRIYVRREVKKEHAVGHEV